MFANEKGLPVQARLWKDLGLFQTPLGALFEARLHLAKLPDTPETVETEETEENPYSRRAAYRHKRLAPPRRFDKRSFRVKTLSRRKKLVVACPKGKWSPKSRWCKVGMRAQAVLTKKNPLNRKESAAVLKWAKLRFLRSKELGSSARAREFYKGQSSAAGYIATRWGKAKPKTWLRLANPVCSKMKKHLRHDIKDFRAIEKKVRGMRREDERTVRGNPVFPLPSRWKYFGTYKTDIEAKRAAYRIRKKIRNSQTKMDRISTGDWGLSYRIIKSNPPFKPIVIYDKTESITMQKGRGPYKGQRFYHNFTTKPTQYGIPAGTVVTYPDGRTFRASTRSVLLSGKNHLWKKFKA
jgi:hypothetical protein